MKIIREGFWYSKSEPNLPKPISNILTENQARKIYLLIRKKEKKCFENIGGIVHYKGFSFSRINGKNLGSYEYVLENFRWPGDYAKHYILEHKVKPSNKFLEFIGYFDNEKLNLLEIYGL